MHLFLHIDILTRNKRKGRSLKNKFSNNKKRHHAPRRRQHTASETVRTKAKANLWGIHAVTEAWLNPARDIKTFYASEPALKAFEDVLTQARQQGLGRPEPVATDRKALDRALPPGAVHQGLAIDAAPLEEVFIQDLIIRTAHQEKTLFVILDQVTDPHNVGAILRSACAFGADGAVMQRRHSPELTGVLAKAACGAIEHIPVAYEINLGRTIETLRESGFTVIGLDERGDKTIAQTAAGGKTAIILGAEGKGLRPSVAEQCTVLARLPTRPPIASLNVSNAAAVALYALTAASG